MRLPWILPALLSASSFCHAAAKGVVVKVDGAKIYLDLAQGAVWPGQGFVVFSEGEELKHPVTGASLGRIETVLGSGRILEVHESYSLGEIVASSAPVQVGQLVRAETPPPQAPPAPSPAAPEDAAVRKPLWRGPLLNIEAVDLAVGDIDGDGAQELILASQKGIQAFPLDKQSWKPSCVFSDSSTGVTILSVETADLDKDGKDEVFVTLHNEFFNRVESYVLACKDGKFDKVASLPWMIRSFEDDGSSKTLAVQQLVNDTSFPFANIYRLEYADGKYRSSKDPIKQMRLEWLYGFGLTSYQGAPLFAYYSVTDRVRIQFTKGSWYTPETYGETANRVRWQGKLLEFHPRLLFDNGPDGLKGVYTLKNIPRFGSLSAAFALFNRSQLHYLNFNGMNLEPAWNAEIGGYSSGLALRPGNPVRPAELLVAVVGGDGRTSVLSFRK